MQDIKADAQNKLSLDSTVVGQEDWELFVKWESFDRRYQGKNGNS